MTEQRDEDRRITERVDHAQRIADGNWSFTGPSSTLSMRQWREPSTMSTMSRVPSALTPSGTPTAPDHRAAQNQPARPQPVQMPTLEEFDYDGDEGPMLPVERLAAPAPLLAPPPLVPEPMVSGPVVGHPNSIDLGNSGGWRPPQAPARFANSRPTRARNQAQKPTQNSAVAQTLIVLIMGLFFFGPALMGLVTAVLR